MLFFNIFKHFLLIKQQLCNNYTEFNFLENKALLWCRFRKPKTLF